jgi:iron complex transport system substrate-binding protein
MVAFSISWRKTLESRISAASLYGAWTPICWAILLILMLSIGLLPPYLKGRERPSVRLRIKDPLGRIHSFEKLPQRIFFAANVLSPFLTLAENCSSVSGMTNLARRGLNDGLLDKVFQNSKAIPVFDDKTNIEEILYAGPDAILGWPYQQATFDRDSLFDFIGFAGQPSPESHLRLWQQLGQLSGREARAEDLINAYHASMMRVEQAKSAFRTRPRVLILVSNNNGFILGGARHSLTEPIELAGAENPIKDQIYTHYSLEDVALFDPDVILISTYFNSLSPESLLMRPEWKIISAVRNGRVYRVPNLPLFTAPVFDPLLIQWLVDVLHPEIPASNLREMFHRTYRETYHYELSEVEIDSLLDVPENKGTLGYERFEARAYDLPVQ